MMGTIQYISKNGKFVRTGECKDRYVRLRILKNGIWMQTTETPLSRTKMIEIIEGSEPKYLPAEGYELIGVPSVMTEEDKEKLRVRNKQKSEDRPKKKRKARKNKHEKI